MRYNNDSVVKDPKVLEFQIAQVNSPKDTMLLLRKIVEKITPGIIKMKPREGSSQMKVLKEVDGNREIVFMNVGESGGNNMLV